MNKFILNNFLLNSGKKIAKIRLSYYIEGPKLLSAPIVLVIPQLNNSDLIENTGCWYKLIGKNKTIDSNKYTILSIDIPGNEFENYKDFNTGDIAQMFLFLLKKLNIKKLYALTGYSLGGCIAWELLILSPDICVNFIPISCSPIANDWLIAVNSLIHDIILTNSDPLQYAERISLLFSRNPKIINKKFNGKSNVNNWLYNKSESMKNKTDIMVYIYLKHLLCSVNICRNDNNLEQILSMIQSNVFMISTTTDILFNIEDAEKYFTLLKKYNLDIEIEHRYLNSDYGHISIFTESDKLIDLIKDIF